MKERGGRGRGVFYSREGGWITQGRQLFKIFPPKGGGDYSRGALIKGRLLFKEMQYMRRNKVLVQQD